MPEQDDVKQIRSVIDDWAAGMRAKDAARVKRHSADDLVHFSLAPPLVADESGRSGSRPGRVRSATNCATSRSSAATVPPSATASII